jgi:mRNA interferase RelE/StbE
VREVYLEGAAERDLKRLTAEEFNRIIENIRGLRENPRPPGCRKIASSKNDWRIRVGSYRIIYEIDDKAKTIKILRIRYRREAYR